MNALASHFLACWMKQARKSNVRYFPIAAGKFPVLAFTGAPAPFPVQPDNLEIQKYFGWNEKFTSKAQNFVAEQLNRGPFVGIHLRNGADWVSRCVGRCSVVLQAAVLDQYGYE